MTNDATNWDEDRDGTFFRIVGHLFDTHFTEGASALLAANDVEVSPAH